jgi:hypothetical protein
MGCSDSRLKTLEKEDNDADHLILAAVLRVVDISAEVKTELKLRYEANYESELTLLTSKLSYGDRTTRNIEA